MVLDVGSKEQSMLPRQCCSWRPPPPLPQAPSAVCLCLAPAWWGRQIKTVISRAWPVAMLTEHKAACPHAQVCAAGTAVQRSRPQNEDGDAGRASIAGGWRHASAERVDDLGQAAADPDRRGAHS